MSLLRDRPILHAQFMEGQPDVGLTFESAAGQRVRRVPLDVFIRSLEEWKTGGDAGDTAANPAAELLRKLRTPEAWVVNALGSSLRYALLVEEDWRVAVAVRSAASVMSLRVNLEDGEGEHSLAFMVPPRLVAGVWEGAKLRTGVMALLESAATAPIAPNDELHYIYPWPWANVDTEGRICWGTATRPAFEQDGVTSIERAFFSSVFNDHITRFLERPEEWDEDDDDDEYTHHNLLSYHQAKAEEDTTIVTLPHADRPAQRRRLLLQTLTYAVQSPW